MMPLVSGVLGACIGLGFNHYFGWWGLCFAIPICFVMGWFLNRE